MDTPSLYHYYFSLNEYDSDCCDLLFFLYCTRRARKKRVSEDSDEDDDAGTGAGGDEDSDVEMADVNARRKSDASEPEKQTRASRLSARTRAKVCFVLLSVLLWTNFY